MLRKRGKARELRPLAAVRCTPHARERRRGASRDGERLAALPAGAAGRTRAGAASDAGAGTGLTAVGLDWDSSTFLPTGRSQLASPVLPLPEWLHPGR